MHLYLVDSPERNLLCVKELFLKLLNLHAEGCFVIICLSSVAIRKVGSGPYMNVDVLQ